MTTQKEYIFPITGERAGTRLKPIPLRVIAPFERRALANYGHTLQSLNDRGGLDPRQALHLVYDLSWRGSAESNRIADMGIEEADRELRAVVRERYARILRAAEEAGLRERCSHDSPERLGSEGVKKCPKCGCLVNL